MSLANPNETLARQLALVSTSTSAWAATPA
jgi:hypothetical protein